MISKSPLAICLAIAIALTGALLTTATAERKPNLIYILLDDAGYGDLSCYGQQKFQTPNIDRLAAEGMKFTSHYSGSTVCAPTRCSLMTGMHTGHAYVRGNREVKPEGQAPMPADIVTIPRLLKTAGYRTGAFGKWGLGAPGSESDPIEHFDEFYGYNCQREAHNFYPTHLWDNDEKVLFPERDQYSHDLIADKALEFVRNHKENPFFIYFAITIPHAAMQVPEAAASEWADKFPEFNDVTGKYGGSVVKNPVANFAAMMTRVDRDTRRLLDLLAELGIDDDTLIMFSSDNGPHKEGGHRPDFWDSNGPYRGYKRDLSEGGIRTFNLARWPGQIEAGSTTDLPSAHWDVLPTFCDLAGVDIPQTDGISMVPTLLGKADQQKKHDYLYWEFYEGGGKRAVRFGDWKAIQLNVGREGFDAPIALYDLKTDIEEKTDLASSNPQLVEKAAKMMAEAHAPSPNWEFKVGKVKKK